MKTTTAAVQFKLLKRIKDDRFDVDRLHHYDLLLQIGVRDFQLCVCDSQNQQCLLLEDYFLEGVKTVNSRIEALEQIFENHHLLLANFWNKVRISLKTHKYTLVPDDLFQKENLHEYLKLNCEIHSKFEEIRYYKQVRASAVNIFAGDQKLLTWLDQIYPNQNLQIVHQGSAFIEGILHNNDHSRSESLFVFVDRGYMHILVAKEKELLYYNQFQLRVKEDYLKYLMMVLKVLKLNTQQTKILFWGNMDPKSPNFIELRKHFPQLSFGNKPSHLKFAYMFDESPDHRYFDLFSLFLCE